MRPFLQQIARERLRIGGERAARSSVSGVSQTRISMVPYSGLGRMSQ